MLILIICGLFLTIRSQIECTYRSDYNYHPEAGGWLKLHKIPATWQQAFLQCHHEGGVLASPLTTKLRRAMQVTIDNNGNSLSYYIGANSKFNPGHYVSIEGVPLANMPTADMYQLLDPEGGECLSTDGYNISVVPCSKRLLYMCYTKENGKKLTECGTFDKGYKLMTSTGSCYKVHSAVLRNWYEANAFCITEGSYLAILDDEKEADLVKNMIPNMSPPWWADKEHHDWEPLYIGLLDWTMNGTWLTNHGDNFDEVFHSWYELEPRGADQYCGALVRQGFLDSIWCDSRVSYFVCEKDPKSVRFAVSVTENDES